MEDETLSISLGIVVVGLEDLIIQGTSRLLAAEGQE